MYHLCDWQRAIQCGPLKVRNRSQAYTVHGQISTMRTCDGQRVKEFQHYLVKDLNPPFDAVALRRGASSMMRSDCGRLLYVGFFFCFGSTVSQSVSHQTDSETPHDFLPAVSGTRHTYGSGELSKVTNRGWGVTLCRTDLFP